MIEGIVLGLIQGVSEWLPISSDGALVLAQVHFFSSSLSIQDLLRVALLLHLGTLCAAFVYLRRDVLSLLRTLISYQNAPTGDKIILRFLVIATLVSGIIGYALYRVLGEAAEHFEMTGSFITGAIGLLLIVTGIVQLRGRSAGVRSGGDVTVGEGVLLGVAQGLAALPGLSRSGLTIAALLLRKVGEEHALRLSFLMSLPIVLAGNIALNIDKFFFTTTALVGVAAAFIFGLLTIHALFVLARKINFGWFAVGFGLVTLFAVLV